MKSKSNLINSNSKKESLTVEKLRSFRDFENISDEEAIEIVFAVQTLANILHDHISLKSKDNQVKSAA